MADNSGKLVTVFGGSGFVGRHVVRALAQRGYRIRVAVRRPDLAFALQPLGNVGQISLYQANVRDRASIDRAVKGADHVVNLVAILAESGKQKFDAVQDFGARAVAEATRAAGARLTHFSAIGADAGSPSDYARTKGQAEKAVLDIIKDAVILRPSIIFGPDDKFFNKFAEMSQISPFLPAIGGGATKFQVVYVGDVAEAVARSVDGAVKGGRIYEIGGPEVRTFKQLMQEMLTVIERKRLFLPIPFWAASIMGAVLGRLPGKVITSDQVKLLKVDNIVSAEAKKDDRTLEGIGITPQTMESILPTYLWRFRTRGQFQKSQRPPESVHVDLIASILPDGLGIGPAALLVVTSFFTSATTAALGLGGGVMMLALMGLFIPVAALIPVQGLVQLGSNTGRAWVQRAHVRTNLMRPFLIGSVVGAAIGGFTVVQLPDQMMKIVLGTFILFITWYKVPGLHKLTGVAFALVSGLMAFLSMFLGATGPLMSSVLAALIPDDRKALLATSAASLVVHHGLKILVFGLAGFAFRTWLPLIAMMIATGYLGTLSGSWLLSRIPEQSFRLAFKLLISVLALDMLRRGLGFQPSV